jgi:hypothetical protein
VCLSLLLDAVQNCSEQVQFFLAPLAHQQWEGYCFEIRFEHDVKYEEGRIQLNRLSGISHESINRMMLHSIRELSRALGPYEIRIEDQGLKSVITLSVFKNLRILNQLSVKSSSNQRKRVISSSNTSNNLGLNNSQNNNSKQYGNSQDSLLSKLGGGSQTYQ